MHKTPKKLSVKYVVENEGSLTNIEVLLTFSINFVHVNQAKNGESWKMLNEDASIVFLHPFSYLSIKKCYEKILFYHSFTMDEC